MSAMETTFLVKRVVRTAKSEADVSWKVYMEDIHKKGYRLTIPCDNEDAAKQYVPQVTTITIKIVNPQTTLTSEAP